MMSALVGLLILLSSSTSLSFFAPVRSASDFSLTETAVPESQKRVWFYVTSPFFQSLAGKRMVQTLFSDGTSKLFFTVDFSDDIFYSDIPLACSSYSFCVVSETTIIARTRLNASAGGDTSMLHWINSESTMDSLQNPISFPSKFVTKDLVNRYLEGYSIGSSSILNGYGAFALMEKNVLSNFLGDQEELKTVFHQDIDPNGHQKVFSAYEKMQILKDEYGSHDFMVIGGRGSLLSLSLLFLIFLLFVFKDKILPFFRSSCNRVKRSFFK
jgi:hypothetical protein